MYPHPCYPRPWHYPMYGQGYGSNVPPSYSWYSPSYQPYGGSPSSPNIPSIPSIPLQDYGPRPLVVNIDQATKQNNTYRTALWTGRYFQVTLMSINVGDDIGLEVHPTTDQFIRIEEGQGLVQMGDRRDQLDFQVMAYDDFAIMVPAGKWHNITNTGHRPLKVYVIYAPPEHPYGTVHVTKADAQGKY
ncbi:cupin domain-containing protein [Paenibacillus sp. YYML68]|uniref:cupin domain-containing protein n=1 Tax=Paenibacillus sp. YYML68 TaxID=2909250 RepID=UPI00249262AB|nr:cupin domain-containing protein [Paenibacillus sp. YYML68]